MFLSFPFKLPNPPHCFYLTEKQFLISRSTSFLFLQNSKNFFLSFGRRNFYPFLSKMFGLLFVVFIPLSFATSTTPDPFLALKCQRIAIFKVSIECIEYFKYVDAKSAPPTLNSPPPIVRTLAGWIKGLISVLSSFITVYGAAVAFFKYVRKYPIRQCLCLGFYGQDRREDVSLDHSAPISL